MEPAYVNKKNQKKASQLEKEEINSMIKFVYEEDELLISNPMHYKRSLRHKRYYCLIGPNLRCHFLVLHGLSEVDSFYEDLG